MKNTNYYQNIQIIENQKIRLDKIKNIGFLIIYAILAFYFLVNGEGIFDNWDSTWTYSTIIYLVGVSIFLSAYEKIPHNLQKPMLHNMIGFIATFLIVICLFIIIRDMGLYFTNINPMPVGMIPAVMIFQLVIVVASEEIIFRGILLEVFYQVHWFFSIMITSLLFSLFHLAVYGGNVASLGFAFLLGIVFAFCVYRWNIGVAIAIHFVWNLTVLGILIL